MFTGIVKLETQVIQILDTEYGKRLQLNLPDTYVADIELGASVAVNGTCLTVVTIEKGIAGELTQLSFDIIFESLKLTNLAKLSSGDWVNIERAARFGDDIGGHQLSGHIHAQAEVAEINTAQGEYSIKLTIEQKWHKYILAKGYIGVNGCSLTLGDVGSEGFWLHLIPETLNITNFSRLQPGAKVNIEIDSQTQAIVDTVERVLAQRQLS